MLIRGYLCTVSIIKWKRSEVAMRNGSHTSRHQWNVGRIYGDDLFGNAGADGCVLRGLWGKVDF